MMKLSQVAEMLNLPLENEDLELSSVSTDTRTLQDRALFVALKGPHFNGNDFVKEAQAKGASAALVSDDIQNIDLPLLKVKDTRLALGALGGNYRQQFNIPLIALTGSCGKTTTKTMLASIMQECGPTLATQGNQNNDIGVPLTLLKLRPEHQFAVVEMGANHLGEIEYIAKMAAPSVAFITNAAPAHLEGFGSLEDVATAKGEIYQGLNKEGVALINIDDAFCEYWQKLATPHKIYYFGRSPAADFTAKRIHTQEGFADFELITPQGNIHVQLKIAGEHNVNNALAAAAAAQTVGASLEAIKVGLEKAEPVNRRVVIYTAAVGATIIDDSYNANPLSVSAAIRLLAKKNGKKVLALGEMRELGHNAAFYHEQIGREAKNYGIDRLYAYGKLNEFTVKGFGAEGFYFEDQPALINAICGELNPDVTILVKGSLSTAMNRVVAALLESK